MSPRGRGRQRARYLLAPFRSSAMGYLLSASCNPISSPFLHSADCLRRRPPILVCQAYRIRQSHNLAGVALTHTPAAASDRHPPASLQRASSVAPLSALRTPCPAEAAACMNLPLELQQLACAGQALPCHIITSRLLASAGVCWAAGVGLAGSFDSHAMAGTLILHPGGGGAGCHTRGQLPCIFCCFLPCHVSRTER